MPGRGRVRHARRSARSVPGSAQGHPLLPCCAAPTFYVRHTRALVGGKAHQPPLVLVQRPCAQGRQGSGHASWRRGATRDWRYGSNHVLNATHHPPCHTPCMSAPGGCGSCAGGSKVALVSSAGGALHSACRPERWGGGVEEGGWVWVVGGWGEPPAAAAPGSARCGQRTWQQATIWGATHPACQPAARARRRRATRPAALPLPAWPAPPVPARRAACGCRAAPLRRGLQEGGAELINPMMQPPPSPQGRIHTCARACGTSNLQLEHRAAEAEAVVSQQGSHPGLVADRAEGLHGACELEGRGACLCACGQGGGRRG